MATILTSGFDVLQDESKRNKSRVLKFESGIFS